MYISSRDAHKNVDLTPLKKVPFIHVYTECINVKFEIFFNHHLNNNSSSRANHTIFNPVKSSKKSWNENEKHRSLLIREVDSRHKESSSPKLHILTDFTAMCNTTKFMRKWSWVNFDPMIDIIIIIVSAKPQHRTMIPESTVSFIVLP